MIILEVLKFFMFQAVKQNLFSLFEIKVEKGKRKLMIIFIRVVFLLSIVSYMMFFYDRFFIWSFYTKKYFIFQFIRYFIFGLICNFGLYFITTEKARRYRVFATLFYLPSIFISPFIHGYWSDYDGPILVLFALSFCIYYYFNPWRIKNG